MQILQFPNSAVIFYTNYWLGVGSDFYAWGVSIWIVGTVSTEDGQQTSKST